jgi:GWxTD domain-containing protein
MTLTLLENSYCQDLPVVSQGKLKFYFDTGSFMGKGDSSYQEFYLMFFADQLNEMVTKQDDKPKINASVNIFNLDDKTISSKNWVTEVNLITESNELKNMVTFDQWGDFLIPGKYNISINITNNSNSISGNLNAKIEVKEMNNSYLHTSDIQFVFNTDDQNENTIFTKSGMNVYPNVWRRYGVLNPKLIFYYEVYGIDTTYKEPLFVDYSIVTQENQVMKNIKDIEIKRTANRRSVIHAMNIENLPSANYNLVITITDPILEIKTSVQRKFEIFQLDRLAAQSHISAEDIYMFDQLFSYLADSKEFQIYKKLNDSEKEIFIVQFWKSKDPTPSTPENEYLTTILERFNYSNQNFGWGNQPGWESDRGRVLIQYGMPYEIESHDSEPSTVPYEVWTYQLDKNYIFVFIDRNSTGKFILTHSTMEGEVSNPSWISLVKE